MIVKNQQLYLEYLDALQYREKITDEELARKVSSYNIQKTVYYNMIVVHKPVKYISKKDEKFDKGLIKKNYAII